MYVVCTINPDGTAATTATPDGSREAAEAFAAANGGEVVSAELVAALRAGDAPPAGGVPVAEFKRRLALVYYRLGGQTVAGEAVTDAKRGQWDRVLSLLDSFTVVYPGVSPVADLVQAAVGDGLLTAAEAAALAG